MLWNLFFVIRRVDVVAGYLRSLDVWRVVVKHFTRDSPSSCDPVRLQELGIYYWSTTASINVSFVGPARVGYIAELTYAIAKVGVLDFFVLSLLTSSTRCGPLRYMAS